MGQVSSTKDRAGVSSQAVFRLARMMQIPEPHSDWDPKFMPFVDFAVYCM